MTLPMFAIVTLSTALVAMFLTHAPMIVHAGLRSANILVHGEPMAVACPSATLLSDLVCIHATTPTAPPALPDNDNRRLVALSFVRGALCDHSEFKFWGCAVSGNVDRSDTPPTVS